MAMVNPIYGCRVRMTPGINTIYAGLERSCPRDSKNVSYVDVGLVQFQSFLLVSKNRFIPSNKTPTERNKTVYLFRLS